MINKIRRTMTAKCQVYKVDIAMTIWALLPLAILFYLK